MMQGKDKVGEVKKLTEAMSVALTEVSAGKSIQFSCNIAVALEVQSTDSVGVHVKIDIFKKWLSMLDDSQEVTVMLAFKPVDQISDKIAKRAEGYYVANNPQPAVAAPTVEPSESKQA